MPGTSTKTKPFGIRIPLELLSWLRLRVKKHGRKSVGAEIVSILHTAMAKDRT